MAVPPLESTVDRTEDYLADGNRELAEYLGTEYRPLADQWAERKRLLELEIELWNKVMTDWANDPDIHFTWEIDKHQWPHGHVPYGFGWMA